MIKPSRQLKAILTIIRDKETPRDDFIFFANRVCSIVVETGLSELSFQEIKVTTPTGDKYNGLESSKKLCGVSIERAGVAMERGLRKVCKDIKIGKLLIQTDKISGDPMVIIYQYIYIYIYQSFLFLKQLFSCISAEFPLISMTGRFY